MEPTNPYQIEHLFTYRLQLAPPQVIGPVPGDLRIDFPIVGGDITGLSAVTSLGRAYKAV
jgi:hypothetical protein